MANHKKGYKNNKLIGILIYLIVYLGFIGRIVYVSINDICSFDFDMNIMQLIIIRLIAILILVLMFWLVLKEYKNKK